MQEITFKINSIQNLCITSRVSKHLRKHKQIMSSQKESGGQLFARISRNKISIEYATGPNFFDKRGRYFFSPSIFSQKREINKFYKKGLHYIGEWHTHPEQLPIPSQQDIKSMQLSFEKSTHELQWFLMLIQGQEQISVNVINKSECICLINYQNDGEK